MKPTPMIDHYFSQATAILAQVLQEERQPIERAADLIVASLSRQGVLHVFGAGHSHLFAEELAYRAGGLVAINPILDYGYTLMGGSATRSTKLERLEGYARIILDNYHLSPEEVLLVVSQSGINPGPVEAALLAKERGLHVVAITCLAQSQTLASRHSSGKRVFEVADVVINNHVPVGDALIEVKPGLPRVAAVSTVIGVTILQSLVAEVAYRLVAAGGSLPTWISSNVPGGDEHNATLAEQYPSRLRSF